MTNNSGRTRQRTNNLRDELFWDELGQVTNVWCIIAPIERYSSHRDFQLKKRKICNHRCPDPVYFITLVFIIIRLLSKHLHVFVGEIESNRLPSVLHIIRYMIFKIQY